LTGFTGSTRFILTIFRLPAIASRSGEAGGDENGQNQCAKGAQVAFGERYYT